MRRQQFLFTALSSPVFVDCALLIGGAQAQQNFDKVEIKTEKLSPTTFVLFGAGGNVGVSVGEDALFKSKVPPSPKVALPVVTFSTDVTSHINGDEVYGFHVPKAHTDGDTVVQFKKSNVIHMGDVFFNGWYPFIDVSSGGSPESVIAAVDRVLAMSDDNTKIIPGHGPVSGKGDLKAYRDMLATVSGRVKALMKEGKKLDEIKAAKPSAEFDEKWGKAFIETLFAIYS